MVTSLKEEVNENINFLTEAKKQLTQAQHSGSQSLIGDIDHKIKSLQAFDTSKATTEDVTDMAGSVMHLLERKDTVLFSKTVDADDL